MEYITAKEASIKWQISKRRVQILCNLGRIKGATKIGNMWVIPKCADKPIDARFVHRNNISKNKQENE